MQKKNVYMVQPTFMNTTSIHFPYAVGALASYAWKFEDIAENYELKKVFFLREKTDDIVSRMVEPFLVSFSSYMWNFEYNKLLAKKIKDKFPSCVIVFGGPQIPDNSKILEKHRFIDILIHFEGEVIFRDLLRAYLCDTPLEQINNISFRNTDNKAVTTDFSVSCDFDFPSPYESGFFDKLCEENPNIDFIPLIETNRGCPNHCAYCSWGKINARVRLFPMERVYADLEWVSRHRKEFLGFADANFGMFPRDEQIADKIIELKNRYGYPQKFQVSYTKDSDDRVFRITQKLNENGMDKGVTLSFQSMLSLVQKNIGRANMEIDYYKALLKKYSEAKIPTYTDLILGLPGETYDSFKAGIDELLEYGQHTSLFVHLCEWLPLAEMGKSEYMQKYGIKFKQIPINQPHMSRNNEEEVQEYSRIVTATYSMTEQDWKKMVLFSSCVLCFHHLGILQLVALYLRNEKNIKYSDFYSDLLSYLQKSELFKEIEKRISDVIDYGNAVVVFDEKFGNVAWPFEEYAFLKTVSQKEAFFADIRGFLKKYEVDEAVLEELISYQMFVIKDVDVAYKQFSGNYDWKTYFTAMISGERNSLESKKIQYFVKDDNVTHSWDEYAKKVLWFGRRGGKNIYSSEIMQTECREDN